MQHAKTISTDVVVIGGGSAGTHAALKVQENGLRVLMLVKGFVGRSGASIFAGNLQLTQAGDPAAAEKFIQVRSRYGSSYLSDQSYLKRASAFTESDFFPAMERRGLYIRRKDDGTIVTSSDPKGGYVWAPNQGFSGTFIMELMRKEVLSKRVPVMQETMATSLLMNDGQVVGVTALDFVTGEIFVVRAKAVIVATGPSNYLATRSTGTREQCANGFAMAFRAGAEMQDMEMQWFHASDVASPKCWMRLHMYPNPLPISDKTLQLYGKDGKMFFHQGLFPMVKQPYYLQLRSLYKQSRVGNARFDGQYYGGYTHVEPGILENYSYQYQFFRRLGFDISKDLIELGITWHMTFGGIRTNVDTMETSIPGLFAAGGVGSHGVGSITYVGYDGTVAANGACERARGMEQVAPRDDQVEREVGRLLGYLTPRPGNGLLPAQVKARIRALMSEKMGYVKSEKDMRDALDQLREIRETLVPRMGLGATGRSWNYDWVDSLDVEDMLDVCDLTVRSSITREESRGYFFREDFPRIDNANWLKHTVARRVGSSIEFEHVQAVQTFHPEVDVEDFLDADY